MGALSPLRRFGQVPSYSPHRLVGQSAMLKERSVQDCRSAKHKTYRLLDDHWVIVSTSKAFDYWEPDETKFASYLTLLSYTRSIQYFWPLVIFCGLMYNWVLFHLGIVNYTFYLSKTKIQYRYNHLFTHLTSLHYHTLIHCCFNMSRKQDKIPDNSGVYFDSTYKSSSSSKYHIWRSFL